MEKINANALALSAGILSAAVYIACALTIAILPIGSTIAIINFFAHGVDVTAIAAKSVSFIEIFAGAIAWFLASYIIGYLFALLYNKLSAQ